MEQENEKRGQRMTKILSELNISPYKFSKELGFKRPDTLYQFISGQINMSDRFREAVKATSYNINLEWIDTGKGQPFVYKIRKGQYGMEFSIDGIIVYPARLDFHFVKRIAQDFVKIIIPNWEYASFIAEVRNSETEGLDFRYTTFGIEDGIKYKENYFTVILSDEWIVLKHSEYWNIDQRNRRGENLLRNNGEFKESRSQAFENALYRILNDIEKDKEIFDRGQFVLPEGGFQEIYRSDSR